MLPWCCSLWLVGRGEAAEGEVEGHEDGRAPGLVGDAGRIVSINHYGASAAAGVLFTEFGFTPETVAAAARDSLAAATESTAAAATPTEEAASGPVGTADAGDAREGES